MTEERTDPPDPQSAARVARVAADAAYQISATAAEAAAAAEVIAATSHLAPSVLVVSMFETLQRQIEHISTELESGRRWMSMATEEHAKVVNGLGAVGDKVEALAEKVTVQNGGVQRALNWMNSHDARRKSAEDTEAGRASKIGVDVAFVERTETFLQRVWPYVLTAAVGGLTVATFFLAKVGEVRW